MIERSIYSQILHGITIRPVTLITGARRVGKTTLCLKLRDEKGFGYVSLRDKNERAMARSDPDMFLRIHQCPSIIDEVQYAPGFLESIEAVTDRMKVEGRDNTGMFVLTCSQVHKLTEKVSDDGMNSTDRSRQSMRMNGRYLFIPFTICLLMCGSS